MYVDNQVGVENQMLINNPREIALCKTRDLCTAYPQPIRKLRIG
jgi:hypothetical protein